MNGTSSVSAVPARLKEKVAIITGGASGFGEATARLFVKQGAKVIIADVQDEKGIALCNDIVSSSSFTNDKPIISYIHCNVTDETDVKNLIDQTITNHGKLDIMFNNAGITGDLTPTILGTSDENFKKVFDINVYGSFLGAKHAARVMTPRKTGVILFTASLLSVMGGREAPPAYTMSKHAVVGLMKNLCVEMGQYGIRVNAISPGYVSTPFLCGALGMNKEVLDGLLSETAVLKGQMAEAMDVAHAALYLASDEAKFVNGLNLIIDGGFGVVNPSFFMTLEKSMA